MTTIADLLDRDLSAPVEEATADLSDAAVERLLRKKPDQEGVLRKLFRDSAPSLVPNIRLEGSTLSTDLDEEQFVRCYPYLPHFIELSERIMNGIRAHPGAPQNLPCGRESVIRQIRPMLKSDRTRIASQPVGVLVSIDRIYELVDALVPLEKRTEITGICECFDRDTDYPGMAGRVAKAICLLELAGNDPPSTSHNLARLLIQSVDEAPPTIAVAAILFRLKEAHCVREDERVWKLNDLGDLRRAPAALWEVHSQVGSAGAPSAAGTNVMIRAARKLVGRNLAWYTRSLQQLNSYVIRTFEAVISALDHVRAKMAASDRDNRFAQEQLSMNITALEARLTLLEKKIDGIYSSPPRSRGGEANLFREGKSVRTAYVIGLFGTGRRYVNELIAHNVGERERYFRDLIRLHPGPTPMIYSGHATIKHCSRAQEPPAVMRRILESVRARFADLIFIYRHPLDSLLTNWIYWRRFVRHNEWISGISQIYDNVDDLCAEVEENFSDFRAFSEGDPAFFAGVEPRFLSFAEFVEETALHRQAASLALRLEDFMTDPAKALLRITDVMSIDVDLSRLRVVPPMTKAYRHRDVIEKVPQFRKFVDGLDGGIRKEIETVGYPMA
jgi:hypothetical protein